MKEENKKEVKVFGHRGWSAGEKENSLESFNKAIEEKLDGVEFDIRRADDDKDKIIISHNPCECKNAVCLEECLETLGGSSLELFVEFKECDNDLFCKTIDAVEKFNLKDKTLFFGFREVAEKFPWEKRDVKMGIISEYPWEIISDIKKYKPDFILMGWDYRPWTRIVFKIMWTILPLSLFARKYPNVKFVIGIAFDNADYEWLKKQKGLYALTRDFRS